MAVEKVVAQERTDSVAVLSQPLARGSGSIGHHVENVVGQVVDLPLFWLERGRLTTCPTTQAI
jgi:hypothetical protein